MQKAFFESFKSSSKYRIHSNQRSGRLDKSFWMAALVDSGDALLAAAPWGRNQEEEEKKRNKEKGKSGK